jgi:hypothetical protein
VPSSFRKTLELVHGIWLLQYAGSWITEGIVGVTVKIQQYVRIREAQPHHIAHDDGGEGIAHIPMLVVTAAC